MSMRTGSGANRPPGNETASQFIARKTRRSFLVAGVTASAGLAGGQWLRTRPPDDGIPAPLRRVLNINERAARAYFSHQRRAREFPLSQTGEPRPNGAIGLAEDADLSSWRLNIHGVAGYDHPLSLTLEDIRRLPRTDEVTELHCIEGWSQVVHWAGARFRDFVDRYSPTLKQPGNELRRAEGDVGYVAIETPDAEYYVGLDMESVLHPQTLLCYEMNGEPLTNEHGAPLRLIVPVKYGIKNLKRIGTVRYTNARPPDYWAERGYDWTRDCSSFD